jgi:hypothetical protein
MEWDEQPAFMKINQIIASRPGGYEGRKENYV